MRLKWKGRHLAAPRHGIAPAAAPKSLLGYAPGVTLQPGGSTPRSHFRSGSKRSAKGSLPKRSDSATQAETAPGTVTASQPVVGIAVFPVNRSSVQPSGDRPEAFRPWSFLPSHRMANASLPIPLPVGSTTVSVIAVAQLPRPRRYRLCTTYSIRPVRRAAATWQPHCARVSACAAKGRGMPSRTVSSCRRRS